MLPKNIVLELPVGQQASTLVNHFTIGLLGGQILHFLPQSPISTCRPTLILRQL